MSLQYNEFYSHNTGLTVGIEEVLFSRKSEYQQVEIYRTDSWGNMLVIDGMVMLSEQDEFVYHEMLTHVPLLTHPDPRNILIIGGGDGGTAREVLKHPAVEHADLVEIDRTVVEACRQHMPEVGDWHNPRLSVHIADGVEHLKSSEQAYDVILVDGSDPVGPAAGLFRKEFYENCYHALREDGVMATQCESPWVSSYHPHMKEVYDAMASIFGFYGPYLAPIPLYPAGLWCFMIGSKRYDPLGEAALQRVENDTTIHDRALTYYNPDIHRSSFALPNFIREIFHP